MIQRLFELEVEHAPGSLERVLGVVRRRRLGLQRFHVDPAEDRGWIVRITAGVTDPEANLALRQFEGLVDVRSARLSTAG